MVALTRLRPDHDEQHLIEMLKMIPSGGTCIEGGAHRGLWTMKLQEHFDHVYAFEPNDDHVKELYRNVDAKKVSVFNLALANERCYWTLQAQPQGTNDGQFRISKDGKGQKAFSARIDDRHWEEVRFIKLDVEGAEHLAILGALQTITRCKPFVMVEQNTLSEINFNVSKNHSGDLLKTLGMIEVGRWNKDVLYGWPS